MQLEKKAKWLRKEALKLSRESGLTHIGSALSATEILVALFDEIMKPEDKLILGKGHCCLAYFPLLRERGYNPTIQGNPELDEENGIWADSGSLGHALPIGMGMAFARKIKNKPGKIYVLMGDRECMEGTIWEALNLACKYKLDNLVVIIDLNKLGAYGETYNPLGLADKIRAIGCLSSFIDGHDFQDILNKVSYSSLNQPRAIVACTVKGKGVSFMEDKVMWHNRLPSNEEFEKAMGELDEKA